MIKKIILCLFLIGSVLTIHAQKEETRYLKGAVPVVDGRVRFDATYRLGEINAKAAIDAVGNYVHTFLIEGEDQLPQSRITKLSPEEGKLSAAIEEYLYFKRKAWQVHRVRFFYQLDAEVAGDSLRLSMTNLHYKYDPEVTGGEMQEDYVAEKWITDTEALTKGGTKLARISGKFRKFTIDRKDELFKEIAKAAGVKFKKRVVEVEEAE